MKVLIFTNGEYGDYSFCKPLPPYDYVLCADNGTRHAKVLGLTPNEILGDFDSCDLEDLESYQKQGVCVTKAPCEKDETDTELAIDRAIAIGADTIYVLGGIGSRIDHSLANIHLIYKAYLQNVKVVLYNDKNSVELTDKCIRVEGEKGDLVSLIPFTPKVTGVYTKNLAYKVEGGTFVVGKPYGVSNYMTHTWAEITLEEGLLLVMKTRD